MITEQEKLEVLKDELIQKENLENEILQNKAKKRRQMQQKSYMEVEYGYKMSEEMTEKKLNMEEY